MSETRYMISDASRLVDVEAHVLRYWEEELGLPIGRNEMGHRYYTEEDIRLFRHIKGLKDGGVQLKAIKQLLPELEKGDVKLEGLLARASRDSGIRRRRYGQRREDAAVSVHYEPSDCGSAGGSHRKDGL